MEWFEALILGFLQGLTEYLPVSSSGHLAIGSALFGIEGEENLAFTIVVHIATVFSTLVILWKEISWIFKGLFKWQMNDETRYVINIIVSMIPVGIVGVFFKDEVEAIFGSGLLIVGCCLLLTALLLTFSYYYKPKQKASISMRDAFISWNESFVIDMTVRYWEAARKAGLPVPSDFGLFWKDVEWMGIQRHLKILGIFARTHYRDGKDKYLADTPRFVNYVRQTAHRYDELHPLLYLMDQIEGTVPQYGYTF